MAKYNSIYEIPAKTFFDILHNKDVSLLIPTENETQEQLEKIFSDIYDDWFVKSENEKAKEYLSIKNNMVYLENKVLCVKNVILYLVSTPMTNEMRNEIFEALINIGIHIDKENDFLSEIERILQVEIGIIQNDINFYSFELESLQSKNEESVFDFYEQLVGLESVMERNLDDEMTLIKYLNYEKSAIKKVKAQELRNKKLQKH